MCVCVCIYNWIKIFCRKFSKDVYIIDLDFLFFCDTHIALAEIYEGLR